jgi:protease IV
MKSFFLNLLASLLGALLGGIILFFLGFLIIIGIASASSEDEIVEINKNTVLSLDFSTKITDIEPANPLQGFDFMTMNPERSIGIKTVLDNIAKAKKDENIDGIFLNLTTLDVGMANLEEIRNALINFKDSTKFVISYAEYYSHSSYYLASVSDKIYMNPVGSMQFVGLGAELMFFKNALEKFGIEPIILRHGKFKSAVEPFMLDKMSEANREQYSTFLNSIWDHILGKISVARNIEVNRLKEIADQLLISTAPTTVETGLIDSLAYYDEILEKLRLRTKAEKPEDLKLVQLSKYEKVPKVKQKDEKGLAKDKVAVIYASGDIVSGKGDGTNIGSESLSKTIREAREDEKIKAIVLRVNSPGGSALASEIIWREMELAKKEKPVIVSMGDLAASGGYYIACGADTIVADPTTLTGSIGVFGIIPNIQKLLNEKIGITVDRVTTNKYSDIGSMTRKMKSEEHAHILKSIEEIYSTFIKHVADGRGLSLEQVDAIGQGRIWSGINALEIGLVDTLGGLETAIEIAAKKAKLNRYRIESFPKKKEPFEAFIELMGQDTKHKMIQKELGNFGPIYNTYKYLMELEGIQARLPFEMIID